VVHALREASDQARLARHDHPADWPDRMRSVLDPVPPNCSSPELAEALDLLGN